MSQHIQGGPKKPDLFERW